MLEIEHLHKSFGEKEVLHDISIHVPDGKIVGFIGKNGAGKTTTLRCACGILEFEQGSVTIGGIDLRKHPMDAKRMLAYLPDNPDLYDGLTALQYISFVADIFGVSASDRKRRITKYAQQMEIYDRLGDPIRTMSHGTKQKVAIISALVHAPKLLILDEPFVGLDPESAYHLKQNMKEICDHGGSVFFSSHVLDVVENLVDGLVVIRDGAILFDGPRNALLQDYASLEEAFLSLEAHA